MLGFAVPGTLQLKSLARMKHLWMLICAKKTTGLIPSRIGVKAERENIKPVSQRSRSRIKSETSSLG